MNQHKLMFIIITAIFIVFAGGGTIGYKLYQDGKTEAAIEAKELAEKEALLKKFGNAESKVTSAEMNPIQENVDSAEEAVNLLPEGEEKRDLLERVIGVKNEINRILKEEEEARLAALRSQIDQAKMDLGINDVVSENVILEVLHRMTHQKVRSEEKWGFVQMTEVNLLAVREVLEENPTYNQNIDMLAIVDNWLKNDFSDVIREHNLFWDTREGTVGKAYGVLSQAEEEALINEQFGAQE